MAGKVTLAGIRAAAEKKYASLEIELDEKHTVTLLPVLKLNRARRDMLSEMSDQLEEGQDAAEGFYQWARIVATDEAEAEMLIEMLGDDLTFWKELQDEWSDRTQAGEA